MENKNFRGKLGEDLVASYLEGKGVKLLARNFRTRLGEIDIITEEKGAVHFIEVKTRLSDSIAPPCEFVNARKQRKIISAALEFLQSFDEEMEVSFDVYEVICKKGFDFKAETLKIHRNAFIVNEENSKGLNLY